MDMPGHSFHFSQSRAISSSLQRGRITARSHTEAMNRVSHAALFSVPPRRSSRFRGNYLKSAHQFMEELSPELQRYVEDYPSIDTGWKLED